MITHSEEQKESLLEVKNVSKSFKTDRGEISILNKASFVVNKGEKVAIIGPSGSGKSTLLSLIGLLDTPNEGSILIAGIETSQLSENELALFRNKRIGFVFQAFELISPFTVTENITSPLEIAGKKVDEDEVLKLINEVGLEARKEAMPFTLSGGEKQRVAIARALANNPDLILADEPTGSLDRATGEKVLRLLLEAVEVYGKTLVIITHDESVAAKMDRVFEIKDRSIHERK
jgi:putative ABC transport system ATP-binding protein